MQIERRVVTLDRARILRAEGEDGEPGEVKGFQGHAAVFGERTLIGGAQWGFVETIRAGAFADALTRDDLDVKFLDQHDPSRLMASTSGDTLRLSEDKTGLVADADPADTSVWRDVQVLLERGDLDKMSFAFSMEGGEVLWRQLEDDDPDFPGMEEREIVKIGRLFDVSTVTYPAYSGTDAGLRGVTEAEVRDIMSSRTDRGRGSAEVTRKIADAYARQGARRTR